MDVRLRGERPRGGGTRRPLPHPATVVDIIFIINAPCIKNMHYPLIRPELDDWCLCPALRRTNRWIALVFRK